MTIKELRTKTGMSRQEFGDYFGILKGSIRNWEQGVRGFLSYIVSMMKRILRLEGKIDDSKKNQEK